MSLFLGNIHYWLYNKIVWAEKMEEDLATWAKTKDLQVEKWAEEALSKFGEATGNKPLEDIIDTKNIHGWLQDKIQSAELRQAYLITTIIGENPELQDEIVKLFEKQGMMAAKEYEKAINTPEDAFKALNDFILEGMPCDRVNQVISSDEDVYSWRTTACLHKDYWSRVDGDITIFYTLRDAWVKAFIEALEPVFKYTKPEEFVHEITKL